MGGGRRKEKVELRDKGEKSLGESTDCNLSARNEQDNIKWGAVSWTIQKAKCTQKVFLFIFLLNLPYCFSSFPMQQSTQHQNGHIYHKYRKSVFKTYFFKLRVLNTLCVWVYFFFFFWKWECLTFHLKIGFSRKAILKIPRKLKQFTLFFSQILSARF